MLLLRTKGSNLIQIFTVRKKFIYKYEVLRKYFGYSSFRKEQEEMVDFLLSGRDALAIMPTRKLKISMVAVDESHCVSQWVRIFVRIILV